MLTVTDDSNDIDHFLAEAAARPPGQEVSLSIREFIAKWGARRRGYGYVQTIARDLDTYGLRSEPPFQNGWIDNHIRLVPAQRTAPDTASAVVGSEDVIASTEKIGTTLQVGSLRTALSGLVSVRREDTLEHAQTLMLRHDYSQLPVLSNRELLGAVSWESIAQRRLHQGDCTLAQCIVPAEAVGAEDDLLPHVPRIVAQGFVFVRSKDRTFTGIVTTTDLSENFLALAEPFLLVGEVERQLRNVVGKHLSPEEIVAAKDPRDSTRTVDGADNLSLGELRRLFEPREKWERFGWQLDRAVLLEALNDLVDLRNDVMHFSPDPVDEDQLNRARNLLRWVKLLAT